MNMKDHFDKEDLDELRQLFIKRIEEIDPDRNACLALSGGTDSVTILFTMLATGRRPECYTFYMDGIISEDLKSARNLCKHFGLKLHEIVVPSDIDTIYEDIKRVIPHCEHIKKTIVQCMIPWLYIYPAMEGKLIINGIGGDDYYATQRKTQVRYSKFGDEAIISGRRYYGNDLRFSGANIVRFAEHFGKVNIDFYNSKEIEEFLLRFSFKAINKPYMKFPSVAAYLDYYSMGAFYRDQTEHSYQINSRLRHCHDKLLDSKYNTTNAKAIIAIYNQIAKEIKNG